MNTIEKIIKLCKETDGLSVHKLEMDLGFGNAYFRSTQKITADRLYLVAKYFNVSADYLLGLSNAKSINPEMQAASKYTGLNDESIQALRLDTSEEIRKILNFFLHKSLFWVLRSFSLFIFFTSIP